VNLDFHWDEQSKRIQYEVKNFLAPWKKVKNRDKELKQEDEENHQKTPIE